MYHNELIDIEAMPHIHSYSKDRVESFDKEAEDLVIVPNQMIISMVKYQSRDFLRKANDVTII